MGSVFGCGPAFVALTTGLPLPIIPAAIVRGGARLRQIVRVTRHWTRALGSEPIEGPLVYARGPSPKKAIASSILVGEMRKWPW